MTTTREAKLEKFYDERAISFGGKGKKFWVKLYEKDLQHLLEKDRLRERKRLIRKVERMRNNNCTIFGLLMELKEKTK